MKNITTQLKDMKRLIALVSNKFFLVSLAFLVWMVFFDRNDFLSQYQYHQQVKKLEQERDFYKKETDQVSTELNQLNSSQAELEKFAREKYLMKKDNEDVYMVVKEKSAPTPLKGKQVSEYAYLQIRLFITA